jgi:hypothetical protein
MSEQINMNNSNNPALPPTDFSTPMGKRSFLNALFQQTKGNHRRKDHCPTNDIGVEADKHTANNMKFYFLQKRKNPVKRINFWKFEE